MSFGESTLYQSTKGARFIKFNFINTEIGCARSVAGIIGGITFGIMVSMIGMLVRAESTFAGVLVFTAISAITTGSMPPLRPTVSSGASYWR